MAASGAWFDDLGALINRSIQITFQAPLNQSWSAADLRSIKWMIGLVRHKFQNWDRVEIFGQEKNDSKALEHS